MRRRPQRFRRGATKVEYAILLFLVLVMAVVVFKVIGARVGKVGTETAHQFDGKGGGEGDKGGGGKGGTGDKGGGAGGAAGANGKSGPEGQNGANGAVAANGAGAGGAGGGAGGAGGGSAGGGGGGIGSKNQGTGSVQTNDAPPPEEGSGIPLSRILAAVFVVLFAVGAFFAFRKGKASA